MKFELIIYKDEPSLLTADRSAMGFVGTVVDQRGTFAKDFLSRHVDCVVSCRWDKVDMVFCTDDQTELRPHEIAEFIGRTMPKRILIEATTLGFVEILLLVSAAAECPSVSQIDFLYVEPESYSEVVSIESPLPHSFALSKSLGKMIPIPGFTRNFARKNLDVHLVAFLGFEPSRLGRILEDDEGSTISRCTFGVGIPAFVPGWENHTIDSNAQYFEDPKREDTIFFSANNPQSAYDSVLSIAASLAPNERMVIAPFGTKPAGIGAIVYAVQNQEKCGVIYDHPIRQNDRSKGVGRCHLYRCSC